jgi:hypothetical protein
MTADIIVIFNRDSISVASPVTGPIAILVIGPVRTARKKGGYDRRAECDC